MEVSEDDEDTSELPEPEQIIESSLSAQGMSPSPAKKRRRIGTPRVLTQPFRSPFKTPLKAPSASPQDTDVPDLASYSDFTDEQRVPPVLTPIAVPSKRKPPTRLRHNGALPSPTTVTTPSPRLAQLQKQHTALLNQLSSVRASLETTNQALEIEASTTDSELEALCRKWRTVSRNAAEEVYAATKERVDGIGGVQAWRKREMEMRQAWQWEYEEGKNTRRDEDTAPEERADKGASRDMRAEKDDGGDLDTRDESEEDEGFTMEAMLRSLDIPLETIGYDKSQQRWVD